FFLFIVQHFSTFLKGGGGKSFLLRGRLVPSFPLRGVSPLKVGVHPPKQVVRLGFCPHQEGAPPLRPRVTFPSRGKSPKARQGLPPLDPASAERSPSLVLRCRLHPGCFHPQTKTDLPL